MKMFRGKGTSAILAAALILFMSVAITSCTERQRKNLKHMKSDIIGLKRKITLYDCNGKVIRQWEGRFKVETIGAYVSFIDDSGKDIKVSGTVIVEEM
jgi:uncharacterized lipoprotein YehR (DUF1307 family)